MTGLRHFKEVVEKCQVPNTSLAKTHYKDLVHCSRTLFNEIVRKLHNTHKGNRGFVDVVLNSSDVMEDTTLMRAFIKDDESKHMTDVWNFYYEHDM